MRIGILTFHRAHNFGAVLQCYALQETIRQKGHDVEIIDYKPPFIEKLYEPHFQFLYLIKLCLLLKVKSAFYYLIKYKNDVKQKNNFSKYRKKYQIVSPSFNNSEIPMCYDRYIIGSDQVWASYCTNGYAPIFWGHFDRPQNSKLYGYAISGDTSFHQELSDDQIRKNMDLFDDVSFREESLRDDIEKVTGQRKEVCVDPTLLTEPEIWEPMLNDKWKEKKYVAIYQVRRKSSNKALLEDKAYSFAKKNGYEVIDINGNGKPCPVEDFVSIIKYAKCIFTSSFHATVFSILFRTPFFTFILNDGHDDRYANLLYNLHLDNHLVNEDSDIDDVLPFDEKQLKEQLASLRKSSFNYLERILQDG